MTDKEFNQIVDEYNVRIYRFLYKNLRDSELCKDAIQEVFMKLYEFRNKIQLSSVKSWLFTTAYHLILKELKNKERQLVSIEKAENLGWKADSDDDRQVVDYYLQKLTPLQRSIIIMRDLEGYDYKEIGNVLQINDAQVKVYLFRARQKLRDLVISGEE